MYYKLVNEVNVDFVEDPFVSSEIIAVVMAPDIAMATAMFRLMKDKYGVFRTSIPISPENIKDATYDEFKDYLDSLM